MILLNSFLLALQLSQIDRFASAEIFEFLEKFFTLVFVMEWTMRVLGDGWTSIFTRFNMFDTFLIFGCGFIPLFILPMVGIYMDKKMVGNDCPPDVGSSVVVDPPRTAPGVLCSVVVNPPLRTFT